MKRDVRKLTSWKTYEKKLLKDKKFLKVAELLEPEFILADSLIKARKKKNLTQIQLARRVGTKQPVISKLETANSKPSISLLKRIAQALDSRLTVKFE
ncbi:MAG: Transcriptional regulator, XRE family [Candidatus Woesebacteria bacterium GW2011_GWB1_39_12]|uniref:Transcriptional regulator, XRE family n=2 Tax=Candidatus Woeseibacteriota TaxID=1752722 RepID=A0A0G0M1X0_9BACT|nr:MAG: Transcriptional regulator, XRE family [Candidatus Woesebacteria bacterium GW2011_GWA1_39_12]KKR01778.1 MAG: Transcriptional regulator, XRE family [Candidatus Woesebacteria bacterium GW2011_GWB1_39_12]